MIDSVINVHRLMVLFMHNSQHLFYGKFLGDFATGGLFSPHSFFLLQRKIILLGRHCIKET